MIYCLNCTARHYPLLLLWCSSAVLINVSLPVLTTYLPKAVIEEITLGNEMDHLIAAVLAFSISIAVLQGFQRFLERSIYHHKFKMNSFYMRKIADKGMTTDYCNQENGQFKKMQSESFYSCNGNYSNLTQVYDVSVTLFSNALGFAVYFGILVKLNGFLVLFLITSSVVSYFLSRKTIQWASDHNEEKISCLQKTNYISYVSGDLRSAKDIRLYHMSIWLKNIYKLNVKSLSGWYHRYAAKVFQTSVFDSGLSFCLLF